MKNCPACGQPRMGDQLKCPDCDVFYSQLDEILFAEQQRIEQQSIKGQLRKAWAAADRQQALADYLGSSWRATPLSTKISLWTIMAFIFVLVFGVLTF